MGYPSNQKGYKSYASGKKGRVFLTMDVSFHEKIPFYLSTSEELIYEKGEQKSEEENLPPFDLVPTPVNQGSTIETGTKLQHSEVKGKTDKFKEPLQVYSRKKTIDRPMFSSIPSSSDVPYSDPSSSFNPPSNPPPQSEVPNLGIFSSDLDLPIALRKGARSCATHHPIQNFVSYHGLSLVFL